MTRREEIEYLFQRSRRFFESARTQTGRGFHDLVAFSLEQLLQLYLRGVLLKLGADYSRVRGVRRLLELVRELTGSEEIEGLLSRFSIELGALEDAYVTSRYVAREYRSVEIEKLSKVVDEVIEVIGRVTS